MTEPRAKADRKLATQWHAATPEGAKAFRIETDQTGDRGPVPSPYLLHSPRNSYALIRNKVNPEIRNPRLNRPRPFQTGSYGLPGSRFTDRHRFGHRITRS